MHKILDAIVQSAASACAIVKVIYKCDVLSTVNGVYQDFIILLKMKRGQDEVFRNLKSRFKAYASKIDANSTSFRTPATLTASMFLANSNLDNSQRIAVLSTSVPAKDASGTTTDQFLNRFCYLPM